MSAKYVMNKGKVPVKIWSEAHDVESQALDQLENISNLPFVYKHIAAMPDVHLGMGATVGSVIATEGAVIPSAVGVDIGCGMAAVKTNLDAERVIDLMPEIRHSIERSIPLGPNGNKRIEPEVKNWAGWKEEVAQNLDRKMHDQAMTKLGSLGGGNHFIEVCLDKENNVWVMLHSGSRSIGNQLAKKHMALAKQLCKQWLITLPDADLSYFPAESKEYATYIKDLNWCQEYALANRTEMMRRVMKDLSHAVNDKKEVERLFEVDCHHNYASMENHFGKNVLLTRKGAIRARVGDFGIIPGSMGARSFIVEGLGNPESFNSASHGAGRKMSRSEAKRTFTLEDLKRETEGVDCKKDNSVLDEIPSAYKDIDVVMANQEDLVKPIAELKQIICIKG